MNASAIAENVITGIIAGVSAGVILAILVESKRYVDFKMKRRRQIRYIRQIVEKFQELILSAQAVPPTGIVRDDFPAELRGKELPLNMVRGAYFGSTYREIVETLELGSDPFRPPGVPNEAGYHKIFDAFEAIKWLKVKSTDRTSLGPRPPEDGTSTLPN